MAISIKDVRITLIWIETFFDLLETNEPGDLPYSFLAHGWAYKEQVKKLLAPEKIPSGLSLPWRKSAGNQFWTLYLDNTIPGHISANKAWAKLIPLRGSLDIKLIPTWKGPPSFVEAFFYPFGTAFTVSFYLRKLMDLPSLVNQAHNLYKNGLFHLEIGEQIKKTTHLSGVAYEAINLTRQSALGSPTHGGTISPHPLSLVTVIRGSGINPSIPISNHPEIVNIQHTFEGLVNWRDNWQTINLPSLDDPVIKVDIASSKSSPGDFLYSSRDPNLIGRVIWFPGSFTLTKPTNSLACYHRNQVLGAIHTESLLSFAKLLIQKYPAFGYLNQANLRWCSQKAALELSNFYTGDHTYRSSSLKHQIDQRNAKGAINQLLASFGKPTI
jgi:hypothetical protein